MGGKLLIYNKLINEYIKEYRKAEWLLIAELGLIIKAQQKSNTVKAYKTLSESFLKSGRLDAEYYQPKYDYLFKQLDKFDILTIDEIADINKSIEPGSDAYQDNGVPFIRVSDLSKFGLSEPSIYLNPIVYKETIRPQKNTILLSKDGSVGIAYKMEETTDVITSGALVHLKLKNSKVLPDYLTLVLNSIVVKLQSERDAGGSIIQHWKPSEIQNLIIPILPMDIQQKISDSIQRSFSLRKESQQLLEEAKKLVENTIEQAN